MMLIKFLLNSISYIFYAFILLVVFFTVTSHISVAGGIKSFLIRSGSMEPTILTGDIVIIQPSPRYEQHNVVTFYDEDNRIVTHRIIKINQSNDTIQYHTKGDANRSIDNDIVKPENIIGKVMFIVPKLGFLATFVRTPLGLMIIIIIPTILIVMDRIIKIKSAKPSSKNSYT